jgi:hypothetical protein
MRFRKIALALFACMALAAVVANAAQAAGWEIGTTENQTGGGTVLTGSESVKCEKHSGSSLILTSSLRGIPVKLSAAQIDCVEAKIDNTKEAGHSEGKLRFTEVSVVEPANCEVGTTVEGKAHTLTTEALTDHVIMDPTSGSTVVFDKFVPEGTTFLSITFAGAKCTIGEETAAVKGSACGEAVHTEGSPLAFKAIPTGTLFKVQSLLFGKAQQETGNLPKAEPPVINCALTLGPVAATLEGAVDNELNGSVVPANAGKPFGSA